ncbi:hypothetical protein BconGalA64_20640 [Burkholderia contaminans]|nr:hypothetical protein BconGalA64_20640 [Burkholderia contaminans]
MRAHDRARAERQVCFACTARADFGEQHVERRARSFRHRFGAGTEWQGGAVRAAWAAQAGSGKAAGSA